MYDFPYEDQARSGLPVPDGLDLADTAVYMALRGLYAYYQLGMISREAAVAEKKRLKKLAADIRRQREYQCFLADQRRYLLQYTEAARSQFRLDPTVEHGYELCAAIDNAKGAYARHEQRKKELAARVGAGDSADGA